MFRCADSGFIASVKGSSRSCRFGVCVGQKGLVILIKPVRTGFSKTSAPGEVAWQVVQEAPWKLGKTEICLNFQFQIQQGFWPLKFSFASVRSKELRLIQGSFDSRI